MGYLNPILTSGRHVCEVLPGSPSIHRLTIFSRTPAFGEDIYSGRDRHGSSTDINLSMYLFAFRLVGIRLTVYYIY